MDDNTKISPDAFLLHPEHRAFVFLGGGRPQPPRVLPRLIAAAILGLAGALGLAVFVAALRDLAADRPVLGLDPANPAPGLLVLGIAAVVTLVGLPLALRRVRRLGKDAHLSRRGVLLPGEIEACTGEEDHRGEFRVRVRYLIFSPVTGLPCVQEESAVRPDLRGQPLPQPDASVAVLFADQGNFRLM